MQVFQARVDYLSMDGFGGVKHFGVWPLRMAAQSCFGTDAPWLHKDAS